jgi:choline transport protein
MLANTAGTRLEWGPWHLRGAFGICTNAFACAYLLFVLFFSFWPPYTPITAADMNYTSVLMVAVIVFSIGYYLIFARKVYNGPIIETECGPDSLISEPS